MSCKVDCYTGKSMPRSSHYLFLQKFQVTLNSVLQVLFFCLVQESEVFLSLNIVTDYRVSNFPISIYLLFMLYMFRWSYYSSVQKSLKKGEAFKQLELMLACIYIYIYKIVIQQLFLSQVIGSYSAFFSSQLHSQSRLGALSYSVY